MRTDDNNNPAAFTTDVAKQAGLKLGVDYAVGTSFRVGKLTLFTAKLLAADPVPATIRVIDKIGYYTRSGAPRWTYIAMPAFVWASLTYSLKIRVIGFHYKNEGGTALKRLFPVESA